MRPYKGAIIATCYICCYLGCCAPRLLFFVVEKWIGNGQRIVLCG